MRWRKWQRQANSSTPVSRSNQRHASGIKPLTRLIASIASDQQKDSCKNRATDKKPGPRNHFSAPALGMLHALFDNSSMFSVSCLPAFRSSLPASRISLKLSVADRLDSMPIAATLPMFDSFIFFRRSTN